MPRKKWNTNFKRGSLVPKLPKSGFSEHMNRSTGWHLSQWKRQLYRRTSWNGGSTPPIAEIIVCCVLTLLAGSIFIGGVINMIKDFVEWCGK
jgi:hypothetical protein